MSRGVYYLQAAAAVLYQPRRSFDVWQNNDRTSALSNTSTELKAKKKQKPLNMQFRVREGSPMGGEDL